MPTFNEKIKVSLWHVDGEWVEDEVYLANIPERPSGTDVMNIQTLHSKEGSMDPTWFNLYGIRAIDRQSGMDRMHSSAYMGRVLMSLHLQPNNRP